MAALSPMFYGPPCKVPVLNNIKIMTKMNLFTAALLAAFLSAGCEKPEPKPEPQPIVNPEPKPEPQPEPEPEVPADPRDVPNNDGIIRVLAVGNSFSADAVEQELWPLFHAVGQKVIIGELYIAGCDLETHWDRTSKETKAYSYRKISDESGGAVVTKSDATFKEGLLDERWDYISLQQGAGHHGQFETFEPWMTNMINYCRENASYRKFKLVYHVPWVAPAHSTNAKFGNYDCDTAKMYSMITETTKKVAETYPVDIIINTVDAIQNGRSSYLGDTFDRDGWHLNKSYGRYTAGCIWFEKIMGQSVLGNPYYPASIDAYVAEICQTAAHEACLHPYQVTDLSRFKDPNPEQPQSGKTLAEWEFSATNAVEDAYISSFTTLPDQKSSLGTYHYSNAAGVLGHVSSNKQAGGRISFVQLDKSKWSATSGNERAGTMISATGLPSVCAALPGDYFLFETTTGEQFPAGARLYAEFAWNTNKYGSKYWLLEYLDGDEWKAVPGFGVKTETISGKTYDTNVPYSETITYNIAFAASEIRPIKAEVQLSAPTKDFKLRMTCCLEHQVNGRHFDHPRTQSVQNLDATIQPKIMLLD